MAAGHALAARLSPAPGCRRAIATPSSPAPAVPCPHPTVPVAAGADIPGVPRAWLRSARNGIPARLARAPGGRHVGSVARRQRATAARRRLHRRRRRSSRDAVRVARAGARLPARGEPVRPRLRRLGDRQRGERPLLRAGAGRSLFAGVDLRW
jgi:hypothetical protein